MIFITNTKMTDERYRGGSWLRAPVAFTEDQGLVLITHVEIQSCIAIVPRDLVPSSGL